MLIKSADDKSKRMVLLESLLDSALLNDDQKVWIQRDLKNLRYGVQGERDAAHYIDNHFAGASNHAVVHDLRLEFEGEVAQIDHLVMARGFTFYLLETKNFNGNLHINERGEFSVSYGHDKVFGIPSPLEQSRRHENVLSKLLERLGIAGRIQRKPAFKHVVLIHPKGTIYRPDAKMFDTSHVIKADQFASWREKHIEKDTSTLQAIGSMLNLRSADTVRDWAEKIVRQHRPANLLALPDFIKPQMPPPVQGVRPAPRPPFVPATPVRPAASPLPAARADEPAKKRLVCQTCGGKISYQEGLFCWNNVKRFGGLQYCRQHQGAFK